MWYLWLLCPLTSKPPLPLNPVLVPKHWSAALRADRCKFVLSRVWAVLHKGFSRALRTSQALAPTASQDVGGFPAWVSGLKFW